MGRLTFEGRGNRENGGRFPLVSSDTQEGGPRKWGALPSETFTYFLRRGER